MGKMEGVITTRLREKKDWNYCLKGKGGGGRCKEANGVTNTGDPHDERRNMG